MANFRTTADIMDSILTRCGEVTSGRSAYESRALDYLNRIHHTIINGGNEFDVELDEPWLWAHSKRPIILELQPKVTGSIALTKGSAAGTFTSAPTQSLSGWHIRINNRNTTYKIASHTAAATSMTLDGAYAEDSGTLNYTAFKLDYELVPSYIIIDETNNKLDFEETASTELTATLTAGSYTPSELATHIKTQLEAVGASTYTVTYSTRTRKFTLASDLAGGGGTFKLLAATGSNVDAGAWADLGFDDEDLATAASHTSTYILGGVSRLIEPFTTYNDFSGDGRITGLDLNRFGKEWPIHSITEGYPTRFAKIIEYPNGSLWVRFNHYPRTTLRVSVDYIPMPRDLKDNAVSVPLIPRSYLDILEFGVSSELLFEKEDSKWEGYASRAGAKLKAMMLNNRNQLMRTGKFFAQTIARPDLITDRRQKLIYGVPEES